MMKEKWYNKNALILIVLFIVLPPIGLYGVLKRNTKVYKKIIAFLLFLGLCFVYVVVGIVSSVSTEDIEKENNRRKETNDNQNLELVEVVDTMQISELKEKVKVFQNYWADSIVQEWNGKFIISSAIIYPDSILFELSESATKSFNSNVQHTLPNYQFNYEKRIKVAFQDRVEGLPKTKVFFVPNEGLKSKANRNNWKRPVFMNRGLVIYSGNEFVKEKLGTLNCKKEEKGEDYYLVLQSDGNYLQIVEYELRSYYWISKDDPNYNSHAGINDCKY